MACAGYHVRIAAALAVLDNFGIPCSRGEGSPKLPIARIDLADVGQSPNVLVDTVVLQDLQIGVEQKHRPANSAG